MEARKHQTLIEVESLVKRALVNMTNQMYSRNIKVSYAIQWVKGDQSIEDDRGFKTKNYYTLKLILTDKTDSPVGKTATLYNNHYPIVIGKSVFKLEEEAYKEFILNGIQSLANITYANYKLRSEEEAVQAEDIKLDELLAAERVKKLKDSITPKIILE